MKASKQVASDYFPCNNCAMAETCRDEATACKGFLEYLLSDSEIDTTNPDLGYKFYVSAFIDKGCDGENGKAFYVWQRDNFAGVFCCDLDFDPRKTLDKRYTLYRAPSRAIAHRMELELNSAESSNLEHQIRQLVEANGDMTSAELSEQIGIKRGKISEMAKRLEKANLIRKGEPRQCRVLATAKHVVTWVMVR